MMFVRRAFSISLLVDFLTITSATARLQLPQPRGWVNDFANMINAKAKQRLTAVYAEVEQETKAQIAVVTIDTTEGDPIGEYAHLLFNKE
jgi:uncharacterized protein